MTTQPRLLDLFCGAGGAAMGYHRAGLEVVGVDITPQPRYPFPFVQAEALVYLAEHGHEFDAIHASPPCQAWSALRCLPWLKTREYPELIEPVRSALRRVGKPYVIENVERAPLLNGLTLCGRMFDLPLYRHRKFECSEILFSPTHHTHDVVIGSGRLVNDRRKGTLNAGSSKGAWGNQIIVTVAGGQCRKDEAERALGIDWMQKAELMQAIPPAYTEYIGRQLMAVLRDGAV